MSSTRDTEVGHFFIKKIKKLVHVAAMGTRCYERSLCSISC